MIKSMTGFASLTKDDEVATVTITIRSVNHKFLDLQIRLPTTLASLEHRLRGVAQKRVSRGRVEITVTVQQRRVPFFVVGNTMALEQPARQLHRRAEARGHDHVAGRIEILRADGLRVADHDRLDSRKVYPEAREGLRGDCHGSQEVSGVSQF